ncbi:MAG: hypothetical protein ACKOET_09340 [Verrucomicrobiota bacterium]
MRRLFIWLGAMAVAGGSSHAGPMLACASCFGRSDSAQAEGMNAGILALLVFVLGVWIAFGSFFVFLVRRSRRLGGAIPGDQSDPQHN